MKIQVIDNTKNEEYTAESDKNLKTWGAVVKHQGKYDDKVTFNVRFDPELYNLTFESGFDQDFYHVDPNSKITKVTCQVEKMMEGIKFQVYADYPRYGAGRHFKFDNECDAITFATLVDNLMSK